MHESLPRPRVSVPGRLRARFTLPVKRSVPRRHHGQDHGLEACLHPVRRKRTALQPTATMVACGVAGTLVEPVIYIDICVYVTIYTSGRFHWHGLSLRSVAPAQSTPTWQKQAAGWQRGGVTRRATLVPAFSTASRCSDGCGQSGDRCRLDVRHGNPTGGSPVAAVPWPHPSGSGTMAAVPRQQDHGSATPAAIAPRRYHGGSGTTAATPRRTRRSTHVAATTELLPGRALQKQPYALIAAPHTGPCCSDALTTPRMAAMRRRVSVASGLTFVSYVYTLPAKSGMIVAVHHTGSGSARGVWCPPRMRLHAVASPGPKPDFGGLSFRAGCQSVNSKADSGVWRSECMEETSEIRPGAARWSLVEPDGARWS